jgi:transposase InsO family protein
LTRYFQFYKHERPHQALENQAPAEVYFQAGVPGKKPTERLFDTE